MGPRTIQTRNIGGCRVDFVETNKMRSGPVLVFVSGGLVPANIFDGWLKICLEEYVEACAVTLPAASELTTFQGYVSGLEAVINILGNKRSVVLVGYSTGGLIAQAVAARNPALIKGLALVASAPSREIRHRPSFWYWPRYLSATHRGMPFMLKRSDAMKHVLNNIDPAQAEEIYAEFRPESGAVLREILEGVDIGVINRPTLVIAGQFDKMQPVKIQVQICSRYHSSFRAFPVGHLVPIEDTDHRIVRFILAWARAFVSYGELLSVVGVN